MSQEYGVELQELFLRMMISDSQLYTRITNILNSDNFDKSLRPTVKFIKEFAEKYTSVPDSDQIHATTGLSLKCIDDLRKSDIDGF